jgi:hypothetical protein
VLVDDTTEGTDRRGVERRVEMLERELHKLDNIVAVMQATLNGLVSTMDSRHKAFERGQDLILKSLDTMEKAQIKMDADIKAPHELSRIVFSPSVVIAIVTAILSIVAGQQASTWGMRSDIRDISTHQALQADVDKGTQKLQEERATTLAAAVKDVSQKQNLQQLEIQNLRETILNQRRSP